MTVAKLWEPLLLDEDTVTALSLGPAFCHVGILSAAQWAGVPGRPSRLGARGSGSGCVLGGQCRIQPLSRFLATVRFPENEEASQLRLLQLELVREGQGCNLVGSAGLLDGWQRGLGLGAPALGQYTCGCEPGLGPGPVPRGSGLICGGKSPRPGPGPSPRPPE